MKSFRFIDLFAGLGGFHVALAQLGGKCVFAAEIDETLRRCYEKNFGLLPAGDLKKVNLSDIPKHDVLCAGFPCQPFSKAGEQLGFECSKQGDLFDYVVKILKAKRPTFFILENVPNILRHDEGKTYERIKERLEALDYDVREDRLSPHEFGIPQIRERAYIVGSLKSLAKFSFPQKSKRKASIESALADYPPDAKALSRGVVECLEAWNKFLKSAPKSVEIPSFPLWSMEWGATYPYEETTPYAAGARALRKCRGSHGALLADLSPQERMAALPSYARTEEERFPKWKIDFIRQNREFYEENKKWIDRWLPSILGFHSSQQKLEWNAKGGVRDIWKYIIQFRASGVRVKRMTHAPSLIAMTTTQVPIIGPQRRYMTPRECARLQSLSSLKVLPESPAAAFKALGNAVNSKVVRAVAEALLYKRAAPTEFGATRRKREEGRLTSTLRL